MVGTGSGVWTEGRWQDELAAGSRFKIENLRNGVQVDGAIDMREQVCGRYAGWRGTL